MKSKFAEIKIEMVMKLKKLTRQAAIREIARINASRRRAIEAEAAIDSEREERMAKRRKAFRRTQVSRAGVSHDNADMISAEEFFGQ